MSASTDRIVAQTNDGVEAAVKAINDLIDKQETVFVGVAGGSGSGKSYVADKIASKIPGSLAISLDDYLGVVTVTDANYDDPILTDFDTLEKNIAELKEKHETSMPVYDHATCVRTGFKDVSCAAGVFIIDGLYAFHERIARLLDIRVCVSGGVHRDTLKRVVRDVERANMTPAESLLQISRTVYPMFKLYIEPTLRAAQIAIVSEYQPLASVDPKYVAVKPHDADVASFMEGVDVDFYTALVLEYEEPALPQFSQNTSSEDVRGSEWVEKAVVTITVHREYKVEFRAELIKDGTIERHAVKYDVDVNILSVLASLGYEEKDRYDAVVFDGPDRSMLTVRDYYTSNIRSIHLCADKAEDLP